MPKYHAKNIPQNIPDEYANFNSTSTIATKKLENNMRATAGLK